MCGSCGETSKLRFEEAYEFVDVPLCGRGSRSIVVQVRRHDDDQLFACKIIHGGGGAETSSQAALEEALHESEIMCMISRSIQGHECAHESSCNSDVIAKCYDSFLCRNYENSTMTVHLVTDLMSANLQSALDRKRGHFSEDDARNIMKHILRAIVLLHDLGVTHRDIKLETILLSSDEIDPTVIIRLSGFKLSKSNTSETPSMTQRCGTPLFAAPEILQRGALYGNKVDEWSSGIVLFIMLSGYPPFWGSDAHELMSSIRKKAADFADPIWSLISWEARDLVEKLLKKDPQSRLNAREALDHPWFATRSP